MWQGSPAHEDKEGPWALTRESLVCKDKKGYEGPKAQQVKKNQRSVERKRTQAWAMNKSSTPKK